MRFHIYISFISVILRPKSLKGFFIELISGVMSLAHANGINISYLLEGNGFPVTFIHGFGSKKEIWKPQTVDFSKKYKTLIFDLRGTGKTERPNYPYTMDMMVEDLRGLLEFLQIKQTHLIGRSFGGMIAQNFVIKYPKYVKKLVLIATNAKFDDLEAVDIIIKNRIKEIETIKDDPERAFWNKSMFVFHQKFRQQLKENPNKIFHNSFSLKDLIKENIKNPSRAQDIINQGNAMKQHKTFENLHIIKNQTLLIAASHDRLMPKSLMEEMNKMILNSELKIIQKAGHFMTLSKAPEVNKLIVDFFNKVD
jgi:pimeloyl-ACP methyl ester carboxylesterase